MALAKNREQTRTSAVSPEGNVHLEFDHGIAWVATNRPEKRNAMNPALNDEMLKILDGLEVDDACCVVVLTGMGDSFSAGMDLKEFFRDLDNLPYTQQVHKRRSAWQW
jgi:trans-feruloyl-CoA hydratase/vanillin synthase